MRASVVEAFSRNQEFIKKLDGAPLLLSPSPLADIRPSIETLWNRKGKRLRCHWLFWFGEWAGVDKNSLETYAWVVEAVHTASLLHDDVVDEAKQRRGGPTSNELFGNAVAVLSGDFFLSDALVRVARKNHPFLLEALCHAIQSLSIGELKQRRLTHTVPASLDAFIEVSHLKTASLFEWAALVGPHLGRGLNLESVRQFARLFGELFQFSDDVLDLKGGDAKDEWADLREGKLNRASYLLYQNAPAFREAIDRDFAAQTVTAKTFHLARQTWAAPAQQRRVYDSLAVVQGQAIEALERLPNHPVREALIGLTQLVTERV